MTITIVIAITGGSVTVVMVVMVALYCLRRRKHRYASRVIVTAPGPVTDATGLPVFSSPCART